MAMEVSVRTFVLERTGALMDIDIGFRHKKYTPFRCLKTPWTL